jgi:SAM-dependent methyltransferase
VTVHKASSPLAPSKSLMNFLDRIALSYDAPILDAPSGFGRNALALAARGYDVVAVDRDISRLRSIEKSAPSILDPDQRLNACGRVTSVCADLTANRLPFADSSFSAVICTIPCRQLFRI